MALRDDVLNQVRRTPGKTDRELTNLVLGAGMPQQKVNQVARQLARKGVIVRKCRPIDNLIGNYPSVGVGKVGVLSGKPVLPLRSTRHSAPEESLSEDVIKGFLETWLNQRGWKTDIAFGKKHGVDVDASRGGEHWVIEVKGPGSLSAMRVNYFLAILGETLQRMKEEKSRYSIALPDIQQYRNLWKRLPNLAKRRTTISALFVKQDGSVEEVC